MTVGRNLERSLANPPLFTFSRGADPHALDTDVRYTKIGYILLRMYPDRSDRPICYRSRTFRDCDKKLATSERECSSVVYAALLPWPYLGRNWVTVRTNHEAFKGLLTMSDANGKLARCPLRLSEVELDIVYRAGNNHKAVDELSGLPTIRIDENGMTR